MVWGSVLRRSWHAWGHGFIRALGKQELIMIGQCGDGPLLANGLDHGQAHWQATTLASCTWLPTCLPLDSVLPCRSEVSKLKDRGMRLHLLSLLMLTERFRLVTSVGVQSHLQDVAPMSVFSGRTVSAAPVRRFFDSIRAPWYCWPGWHYPWHVGNETLGLCRGYGFKSKIYAGAEALLGGLSLFRRPIRRHPMRCSLMNDS